MQRSALCRSRRELSNAYFLAKFSFDTAENGPSQGCPPRISIGSGKAQPRFPTSSAAWMGSLKMPSIAGAPCLLLCLSLPPEEFSSDPPSAFAASLCSSFTRSDSPCRSRSTGFSAFLCFSIFFELLDNVWQTLRGPFSAVSTTIFASKYSFKSS